MAAPAEIKLDNLNGDFIMNKKLSDEFEPILSLVSVLNAIAALNHMSDD